MKWSEYAQEGGQAIQKGATSAQAAAALGTGLRALAPAAGAVVLL